jgi:hypothetical protein
VCLEGGGGRDEGRDDEGGANGEKHLHNGEAQEQGVEVEVGVGQEVGVDDLRKSARHVLHDKYKLIQDKKRSTSIDILCEGFPEEFR